MSSRSNLFDLRQRIKVRPESDLVGSPPRGTFREWPHRAQHPAGPARAVESSRPRTHTPQALIPSAVGQGLCLPLTVLWRIHPRGSPFPRCPAHQKRHGQAYQSLRWSAHGLSAAHARFAARHTANCLLGNLCTTWKFHDSISEPTL